jgi:phage gpG-like protein
MSVELDGWERLKKALIEFSIKFHRDINDAIGQHIISKSVKRIKKGKIKPPTSSFTLSLRPGNGKGKTLMDTGELVQSLTYQLEGDGIIKIGSHLRYAKVHQFGAKIKAKKAQTLCIPATEEARKLSKAKGVKGALEEFKKKGYRIWFEPHAIMGQKGKRAKPKVLFYRKKEVEIPKRTFVYMTEKDWEEITEMVQKWLKE